MLRLCIVIIFILNTIEIGNSVPLQKECISFEIVIDDCFRTDSLIVYIERLGIKHPDIVYAQAILETGEFTSPIFRENNNLFGMKYVKDFKSRYPRPTTAIGSQFGHAVYNNWRLSVDDYQLWQDMFKKTPIESESDYLQLLDSRYAVPGKYVPVLRGIINKVRKDKKVS